MLLAKYQLYYTLKTFVETLILIIIYMASVVGEGHTAGAMEASREIEEQLGIKNRKEDKDHKSKDKDKNKEKKEEVDEEIIKVYDGYNSLRKRLFRTITVPKTATKDELLHASMKAFVVTQVVEYRVTYENN